MAVYEKNECVRFYKEDDEGSIFSKGSCYDKTESQMRQKQFNSQFDSDFEIWRLFQVDNQNTEDILNANEILQQLNTRIYERKHDIIIICSRFSTINNNYCIQYKYNFRTIQYFFSNLPHLQNYRIFETFSFSDPYTYYLQLVNSILIQKM